MKVTKLAIILNREIDTNVSATIVPFNDEKEAELIISVHSFEAYKQFMKNPILTEMHFDIYDAELFKNEKVNQWVKTNEYIDMVRKTKLKCQISKSKRYNAALFNQPFPITIDLRNMSFIRKLEILTDPSIKKSIYFLDDYTADEEVSLEEMNKMYQFIWNIAHSIDEKNYTQLESIFYIYDQLKNKIYNEEKEGENANKSRSLNQVINGDNIVCLGYTNYFLAISNILGLNVEQVLWNPTEGHKSGHASLIAFINDPIYEINGIWCIDTTWDSKKNNNDNEYKNNLSHFLMPIAYDEKEKAHYHLEYPHGNHYHIIGEAMERYRKLTEYHAPKLILDNVKESLLKKVNSLYKLIGYESINIEEFDPETEFKKIQYFAYKSFPLFKLDQIVNNVTPKTPEDSIKSMQTTCSYKCLTDDGKSVYCLIRKLTP